MTVIEDKLLVEIRAIVKKDMVGQKGTKYYEHCKKINEKLETERNVKKILKIIEPLETYPRVKIKDLIFEAMQPKNPPLIVMELLRLKDVAARQGLFKTMHSIDEALKTVGYELADQVKKSKKNG
jgi:hypothetical protein